MSISAQTRKLLWARAHDTCAICRKPLTRAAESPGRAGIVLGEEAHIVAREERGPRGLAGDRSDIDGYANLLLLCADDHKVIDTQPEAYPVDRLRKIKADHELWAAKRWEQHPEDDPIRFVKAPGEDSIQATAVLTGKEVWDLVANSAMYYLRTVEGDVDEETARRADEFLDAARDWGDIAEDVLAQGLAAERDAQASLQAMLEGLWQHGAFVYGRRVVRTVKGGVGPPKPWPVTHLIVLSAEEVRAAAVAAGLIPAADLT